MIFLKKKKVEEYVVIIGCGRLGASLANTISDNGGDVLIMDKDKTAFRKLSSSFGGLAVVNDGLLISSLTEADIKRADRVIVVTDNDNVNSMVALLAHVIYGVERIIVRICDPKCEIAYKEYGFETICPSDLTANEIMVKIKHIDLDKGEAYEK